MSHSSPPASPGHSPDKDKSAPAKPEKHEGEKGLVQKLRRNWGKALMAVLLIYKGYSCYSAPPDPTKVTDEQRQEREEKGKESWKGTDHNGIGSTKAKP